MTRRNGCMVLCLVAQLAVILAIPSPRVLAQAPAKESPHAGPPSGAPPGDPLGPDLFIAIRGNNPALVGQLLDKGAQTEAKNWLGITPLLWAALKGNQPACEALLAHKANVNGDSIYGAPLEFAVMSGKPSIVKLLIEHGARFSEQRSDKNTPVMTAAGAGNTEVLRLLLQQKPDVNATDVAGMTALSHAARRGQTKAVTLLLDSGANSDPVDEFGRTPLMYAAMNGYPDVVRILVAHGAKVNTRDKMGDCALVLAARYSGDPAVASSLLKAGADKSASNASGRTSAAIAWYRGYTAFAKAIEPQAKYKRSDIYRSITELAENAAMASLPLIEKTTRTFSDHGGCPSCHHQGLGLITTGTAGSLGYAIDKELVVSEQKIVAGDGQFTIDDLRHLVAAPEMYKHFVSVDMNEMAPGFGSTFCGLISHGVPTNEPLEALSTVLARQQMDDGSWGYGFGREPIESSPFTTTAYCVRVINTYMPSALMAERNQRVGKAVEWLKSTPAQTNEDKAFRLLALKWANAPSNEIEKAVADLKRTQRRDGGWAQFPKTSFAGVGYTRSDAYATGESLYALHVGGGVKTTDSAYVAGLKYLLNTQDEDGSWFVNKRAVPANNYFDTGFPHGESQYISYAATCWSTMALMFAAKADGG